MEQRAYLRRNLLDQNQLPYHENIPHPPTNNNQRFTQQVQLIQIKNNIFVYEYEYFKDNVQSIQLYDLTNNKKFLRQMEYSKSLIITHACDYIKQSRYIGLEFIKFWIVNRIFSVLVFRNLQEKFRDVIVKQIQRNFHNMVEIFRENKQRQYYSNNEQGERRRGQQIKPMIWVSQSNEINEINEINEKFERRQFELDFISEFINKNNLNQRLFIFNQDDINVTKMNQLSMSTQFPYNHRHFPANHIFKSIMLGENIQIPYIQAKKFSKAFQNQDKQRTKIKIPIKYVHIPILYWKLSPRSQSTTILDYPIACYDSFQLASTLTCRQLYKFILDIDILKKIALVNTVVNDTNNRSKKVQFYQKRYLREQVDFWRYSNKGKCDRILRHLCTINKDNNNSNNVDRIIDIRQVESRSMLDGCRVHTQQQQQTQSRLRQLIKQIKIRQLILLILIILLLCVIIIIAIYDYNQPE